MRAAEMRAGDEYVSDGLVAWTVQWVSSGDEHVIALVRCMDGTEEHRVFPSESDLPLSRPPSRG